MNRFVIFLLFTYTFSFSQEIYKKDFNSLDEVTKQQFRFNKATQYKVENGFLETTPPVVALKNSDSKWKESAFCRTNFLNLPQNYSTEFKILFKEPTSPKRNNKAVAYIDLGHRCIRLTITKEKTILILENNLLGKKEKKSLILLTNADLKLTHGIWYTVTTKVYKDEVWININGTELYAKHNMISKDRSNTFNIDVSGEGYLLDYINFYIEADLL